MAPRKTATKEPRKVVPISDLRSVVSSRKEQAKKASDRAERFGFSHDELEDVADALRKVDEYLRDHVDAGELAGTVRTAWELAQQNVRTSARKLENKQAAATHQQKLVLDAEQEAFDHEVMVRERAEVTPVLLRALYCLWDADSPDDRDEMCRLVARRAARVPQDDEADRRLKMSLLDEFRSYLSQFVFSASMSTRTVDNVSRLTIRLYWPGDLTFFLQHASAKTSYEEEDDTYDNGSVLVVCRGGERLVRYKYVAGTDKIVSSTCEGVPRDLEWPDALTMTPRDLSNPDDEPYKRFLRFLIMGFPYRCLTSGTLSQYLQNDGAKLASPKHIKMTGSGGEPC